MIHVKAFLKFKSIASNTVVSGTASAPMWYDNVPKLIYGFPIKDISLIVGIIFTLIKIFETKTVKNIMSYLKSKFNRKAELK